MSFIVFSFVVGLRIYYLFICIYYHFYRSIICVASFAPVIERQFHRVRFRPTISSNFYHQQIGMLLYR